MLLRVLELKGAALRRPLAGKIVVRDANVSPGRITLGPSAVPGIPENYRVEG